MDHIIRASGLTLGMIEIIPLLLIASRIELLPEGCCPRHIDILSEKTSSLTISKRSTS